MLGTVDSAAARVCEVLRSRPEPAVVVAHSMGGVVATQAVSDCPDGVAALIFVCAFMPADGQSLLDLTQTPEGAEDQIQANLVISGEPPVATLAPEATRDAIYNCCTDEHAAWAVERRPRSIP